MLSDLREEGAPLYPTVFLTKDIKAVTSMLPISSIVWLGKGEANKSTIREALKEAAPLARSGWAIFLEERDTLLEYGIFRSTPTPLALSASDLLMDEGEPLNLLRLDSPAPRVTSLAFGSRTGIEFRFGGTDEDDPSAELEIERFAEAATADMDSSIQDTASTFATSTLRAAIRQSHGVILGVISPRKKTIPNRLRDCVSLTPPLEFEQSIADLLTKKDAQAMADLESKRELLTGMLASDGITLFRTDLSVVAYRSFIKPSSNEKPPTGGGARSRAYFSLNRLLGKDLNATLFRSQDGRTIFTSK